MYKYDELLLGKQFGTLTILSVNEEATNTCKGHHRMYNCICSKCGKMQIIRGHSFLTGNTTTCNYNRYSENKFLLVDNNTIAMFDEKGYYTFIDKDDYFRVKQFYWFKETTPSHHTFYWRTSYKGIYLHKFIMNSYNKDQIVDHVFGNPDDNRKKNLRFATARQNSRNMGLKQHRELPVGVCYDKFGKRYMAYIRDNNGKVVRKYFYDNTPENAIKQRLEWENIYYNDGFKPYYKEQLEIPIKLIINENTKTYIDKNDLL